MEKVSFTTTIHASPERVWDILWGQQSYEQWTSVFSEGSTVETDWNQGSKVLFLDGSGNGMVSEIAKVVPHQLMSFHHKGMIKDGVEDVDSEEIKSWGNALENYMLTPISNGTELVVELDLNDEWKDYFEKTWPQALAKLKGLAEQDNAIPPVSV